jgi:hypothetical protein
MAADTPASSSDLATLLGLSQTTPPDVLTREAARTLADRLARDPSAGPLGGPDQLGELLSQGFLTSSAPSITDATLNDVGGRGQIVVTVAGGGRGGAVSHLRAVHGTLRHRVGGLWRRLRRR